MMELVEPECFLGLSRVEKYQMILASLGSEECVFTEQEFYREWLLALDPDACPSFDMSQNQLAIYTILYG